MSTSSHHVAHRRALHYMRKYFAVPNILDKCMHKLILSILIEEYEFIRKPQGTGKTKGGPKLLKKPRKQSKYLQFCEYMKKEHPENKNVQKEWQKMKNKNWQVKVVSMPILTPFTWRAAYGQVMLELLSIGETESIDILHHLRMGRCIRRSRPRVNSPPSSDISDEEGGES